MAVKCFRGQLGGSRRQGEGRACVKKPIPPLHKIILVTKALKGIHLALPSVGYWLTCQSCTLCGALTVPAELSTACSAMILEELGVCLGTAGVQGSHAQEDWCLFLRDSERGEAWPAGLKGQWPGARQQVSQWFS